MPDNAKLAIGASALKAEHTELRLAVRLAYRDSLRESEFATQSEFYGRNHEMTVSKLDTYLSKMLSGKKLSDDELRYIEDSLPRLKGKLEPDIMSSLQSEIHARRSPERAMNNQISTVSARSETLQSPLKHGRDSDSERISASMDFIVEKNITSSIRKMRSHFESEVRKSFENAKNLRIEWIVSVASTELKKTLLKDPEQSAESKIPAFSEKMRHIFLMKFKDEAKAKELSAFIEGSLRATLRSGDQLL